MRSTISEGFRALGAHNAALNRPLVGHPCLTPHLLCRSNSSAHPPKHACAMGSWGKINRGKPCATNALAIHCHRTLGGATDRSNIPCLDAWLQWRILSNISAAKCWIQSLKDRPADVHERGRRRGPPTPPACRSCEKRFYLREARFFASCCLAMVNTLGRR